MRILTSSQQLSRVDLTSTKYPYIFIDLDRKACIDFFANRDYLHTDCSDVSYPPLDFLGSLIAAVSKAEAKAIILDYQLPSKASSRATWQGSEIDRFRAVLTEPTGTLVIAPLPLSPGARPADSHLIASREFIDGASSGRLRLAGFLTWTDPVAADGVVRGYPAAITVTPRSENESYRYYPSAPLLAAMVAEAGVKAADALFYGGDNSGCASAASSEIVKKLVPEISGRCGTSGFVQIDEKRAQHLFFSINSLALPARDGNPSTSELLATKYYGSGTIESGMLYRHIRLADKIRTELADPFSDLVVDIPMKDMIVVIGTSAEESADRHTTPLGRMAGPEVLINATRAFIDFSPITNSATLFSSFASDLPASSFSAAIVFLLAVASEFLRSAANGRAQAVLALLACEFITVAGITLAVVTAMAFASWQLVGSAELGNLDILLPVSAVLFQSILEFFVRILKLCEIVADWIISLVQGGFSWLLSRL